MKYLKENSPPELKMQKLEKLMKELNIFIGSNSDIYVNIDGKDYIPTDNEMDHEIQVLPRSFDNEVLVLFE
jgi:hypothetical protein